MRSHLFAFIYRMIYHYAENSAGEISPEIMKSLSTILSIHNPLTRKNYISREFQDYGLRLAQSLNDMKNKSLYIKLAKITPRRILEEALTFVKDAYKVKSKVKLFMWKLKEIKEKTMVKNGQNGQNG